MKTFTPKNGPKGLTRVRGFCTTDELEEFETFLPLFKADVSYRQNGELKQVPDRKTHV